jgi:hypothetical protein
MKHKCGYGFAAWLVQERFQVGGLPPLRKKMANPVGGVAPGRAKAREPYQNFDEGRSLPGVNYIPLPMIGEGLGEWFEAPSYEEGVGVDGR